MSRDGLNIIHRRPEEEKQNIVQDCMERHHHFSFANYEWCFREIFKANIKLISSWNLAHACSKP